MNLFSQFLENADKIPNSKAIYKPFAPKYFRTLVKHNLGIEGFAHES